MERVRIDLEVHLRPFFGEYLLSQIGPESIERYVAEKVSERRRGDARALALEKAASHEPEGSATVRRQLADARRERGLSNVSINKTLTLLRQVLAARVRYGFIDRNRSTTLTASRSGRSRSRSYSPTSSPRWWPRRTIATGPLLWTLLLAGLRIGEALALRWSDVEFLADPPRLNITRTWDPASKLEGSARRGVEGPVKTEEEGSVAIGEYLLKTLLDHKEQSRFDRAEDLVFPTSKGHHRNPSNFRRRVLAPAVDRANELRAKELPTIPGSPRTRSGTPIARS